MKPEQARPSEFEPAFHLLLRHLPRQERDIRVGRALDLLRQGLLDPCGLFVLRGHDKLLGVIACEPVAGAAGILWPPSVADRRPDLEDLLVEHACAWLRKSGACIGQCLLPLEDVHLGIPLIRYGFSQVTSLSYLCHDHLSSVPRQSPHGRLRFESYDRADPILFRETLAETYTETFDCPEVNGVRTVEEVVKGHQAPTFDPARWWLAWDQDKPAGVIITSSESPGESWELGYMGVVPAARGLGLGREILLKVLREARAAGAERITLCVDDRNTPARRLYHHSGFFAYDQRAVLLAIWPRVE